MKLTEDDLEWLDRIGVDSKRMKIIKQDQKLRELMEKRIEEIKSNLEHLHYQGIMPTNEDMEYRTVAQELQKLLKESNEN